MKKIKNREQGCLKSPSLSIEVLVVEAKWSVRGGVCIVANGVCVSVLLCTQTGNRGGGEEKKITDSLSDSVSAFVNIQYVASA